MNGVSCWRSKSQTNANSISSATTSGLAWQFIAAGMRLSVRRGGGGELHRQTARHIDGSGSQKRVDRGRIGRAQRPGENGQAASRPETGHPRFGDGQKRRRFKLGAAKWAE